MGRGAVLRLLTLLAVLLGASGASLSAAKKVGFFTNFLQKSGSSQYDGEFALRWLEDASVLAGRPGVFLQPGQCTIVATQRRFRATGRWKPSFTRMKRTVRT